MMITRRHVLTSLVTAQLFARQMPALADEAQPYVETLRDGLFEDAQARLTEVCRWFYSERGYTEIPSKALITGTSFNSGLRYDEFDALKEAGPGSFVVQNVARVDDIGEQDRHDVLPYFHVLFCNWREGETPADALNEKLDFLIDRLGVAPGRLAIVGADALTPYRPLFEARGIAETHVFQREETIARAWGDGSGWFPPEGHPEEVLVPTAGFYVWIGEGEAPAVTAYPLDPSWIEIGETGLDPAQSTAQGFGLERLVYALVGLYPSWHDRKHHLLDRLRVEMAAGAPEPAGYGLFRDG